jgi:hypothetical protein
MDERFSTRVSAVVYFDPSELRENGLPLLHEDIMQ